MKKYTGLEKRKHPRINVNFIVSYKIEKKNADSDLSQSKDVSRGGMLITTNCRFDKGTRLLMTIRFPFMPSKVKVKGEVIDSKEVVRNIIYNTRIVFFGLEEAVAGELASFVSGRVK